MGLHLPGVDLKMLVMLAGVGVFKEHCQGLDDLGAKGNTSVAKHIHRASRLRGH